MIRSVILSLIIVLTSFAGPTNSKYEEFKDLSSLSYLYRMQVVESYAYLKKIMNPSYLLTANDLRILQLEMKKRYDLGKKGFELLSSLKKEVSSYKHSEENLLSVLIFLGTFVTMSDSYLFAYDQFSRNYKLRRLLDEENISIGQDKGVFKKSIQNLYSLKNRKVIIKAFQVFEKNKSKIKNINSKSITLKKYIQKTFTYKEKRSLGYEKSIKSFYYFVQNKLKALKSNALYNLRQRTMKILFSGSRLFGNTAGLFASRKGKLFNDKSFINSTGKLLRPLDVLLEKTPFRLTDKFIPGYWGHAAIYVGNEKQLRSLSIWNHPVVKKYHKEIKAGRTIVEALRSGVEINSVKSFSNIDDFSTIRLVENLPVDKKIDYLLRVFSQIGKEYDFAFNVETSSKIVCSELHYLTYRHVKFDIEYILGQPTISVDSVAKRGFLHKEFHPISLYIDGRVASFKLQKKYEDLIEGLESRKAKLGIGNESFEEKIKLYLD